MTEKADIIKSVHKKLREAVQLEGDQNAEKVWEAHLQDKKLLQQYGSTMLELAKDIWEKERQVESRITWLQSQILDYYHNNGLSKRLAKEQRRMEHFQLGTEEQKTQGAPSIKKIKLLDVGSCYNPFDSFSDFDVTALDLQPSNPSVLKCDFLSLNVSSGDFMKQTRKKLKTENFNEISSLERESFDIVVFCYLLDYIPSPRLRLDCCKKALSLLKPNGILCIASPDSKCVNANVHLFKTWQIALMNIGFERIKYEKRSHFHGMIFRKVLLPTLCEKEAERELDILKSKTVKLDFDKISLTDMIRSLYIFQEL